MFEFLSEYKENDPIHFNLDDNLKTKCKEAEISVDCCGVYVVYAYLSDGRKDVVYIGSSGHIENGEPEPRKGGLGRRIYGRQKCESGELVFRYDLWPQWMKKDSISKLEIYWYNTERDNPLITEFCLILEYVIRNKRFPAWNNELKLDKRYNADLENFIRDKNIEFLKVKAAE